MAEEETITEVVDAKTIEPNFEELMARKKKERDEQK